MPPLVNRLALLLAAGAGNVAAHDLPNSHAKVVAAALVAELNGSEVDPAPLLTSACYSSVDASCAAHVTGVHAYLAAEKTYRQLPGTGARRRHRMRPRPR